MNRIKIIAIVAFVFTLALTGFAQNYLITDYGAIADGVTLNSKAIQSAIDKASSKGGGIVVVPEGVFLTGTLELKSNVELHLNKEATLLGSTDIKDYYKGKRGYGLIVASNQENITLSGEGTINGQGKELALAIDSLHHSGIKVDPGYNVRRQRPGSRPRLLFIVECKNVKVMGVTAMNSANWVLNFEECDQLEIDHVRVDSDAYWNNDGIDIGDCKNVRITNCYVNAADDGICLKSGNPDSFCDQIYIADNTIRSSASAIKFGTASAGGFKNVVIENITIFDTFRSALAFEAVDGGVIENVTATNIIATNTGNAIFIKLGHRNTDSRMSTIKNISISNLKVIIPVGAPDINYKIRGPELAFFHNPFPASITGLPGHDVENVTIENVEISYPGRADQGYAQSPLWRLESVPESASQYPEFHMFGELPSWGFYVRHVDGLKLKNVDLTVRESDFRPAYVFDDVKNLTMDGGSITPSSSNPQIILRNVAGGVINDVVVGKKKVVSIPAYGKNLNVSGVNLELRNEIKK